jgi:anti-sigma regulatory factor (Ser/Thr protein kinase)
MGSTVQEGVATGPVLRTFRRVIAATPHAPAVARRLVRAACRAWRVSHLVADMEVVATELVGNVVRHVGGTLDLRLTLHARHLRVTVRDGSPVQPIRRLPDRVTGEGGRGLLLVDAIAVERGATVDGSSKVVWATLQLNP